MVAVQADIILAINEEYGTDYDQEAPWHSLFAEDPPQVCPITASPLSIKLHWTAHLWCCSSQVDWATAVTAGKGEGSLQEWPCHLPQHGPWWL